jgi:DNA-binding IclR family transcriptional regulator
MEYFTKKEIKVLNCMIENQKQYLDVGKIGIADFMLEDLAVKVNLPIDEVKEVLNDLVKQRFVETFGKTDKLYYITEAVKYLDLQLALK